VLDASIKANNYVASSKILSEARDFVMGNALSQESYEKLESFFNSKLTRKLRDLGFIDVSGKILSTTFWAMVSSGNLALKGPPGVGKSFFSKVILPNLWMFAGKLPRVITIQPDRNMDIASLVADRGIKKGDTIVEEGQIADAVNLANKGENVILVLEEINQWPPKVLKDLNDFLEERRLERKIAGKFIKLECPKDKLFIIANYNPEGYTLGEDDTGSVSSRFIFCDLPFPSKKDLQSIIEVNISDKDFNPTSIGDEVKRRPTKPLLRSMGDICYSIRSSIDSGELGPLAMPIGTRNIINFSKALINNNIISDAVGKSLVDPILEKYVREGPLTNIEPETYLDYTRTIFKAVKQVLGSIDSVNEKDLRSLQKGLSTTISELFQIQGKKPYEIEIQKGSKRLKKKPSVVQLELISGEEDWNKQKEPETVVKLPASVPDQVEQVPETPKPAPQPNNAVTFAETASIKADPQVSPQKAPIIDKTEEKPSIQNPSKKHIPAKKKPLKAKSTKAFIGLQCLKCGSKMSLAINARGKRNLICDNSNCRNILPIPQYGEIRVMGKICKICGSTVLRIIRRHGKIVHICPVCWRSPEVNGPCQVCPHFSECIE
jgi:hypothetical protein